MSAPSVRVPASPQGNRSASSTHAYRAARTQPAWAQRGRRCLDWFDRARLAANELLFQALFTIGAHGAHAF